MGKGERRRRAERERERDEHRRACITASVESVLRRTRTCGVIFVLIGFGDGGSDSEEGAWILDSMGDVCGNVAFSNGAFLSAETRNALLRRCVGVGPVLTVL